MQIVIDIPEPLYHNLKNGCGIYPYRLVYEAIINGTPIPKGHGRLIDADAFIKQESCCGYIEDMDIDYFKQNVPTIIEADKAESGENK